MIVHYVLPVVTARQTAQQVSRNAMSSGAARRAASTGRRSSSARGRRSPSLHRSGCPPASPGESGRSPRWCARSSSRAQHEISVFVQVRNGLEPPGSAKGQRWRPRSRAPHGNEVSAPWHGHLLQGLRAPAVPLVEVPARIHAPLPQRARETDRGGGLLPPRKGPPTASRRSTRRRRPPQGAGARPIAPRTRPTDATSENPAPAPWGAASSPPWRGQVTDPGRPPHSHSRIWGQVCT